MGEVIEMNPDKGEESKEQKKLSYEELKNVCSQLQQQCQQMYQQLMASRDQSAIIRMNYLFKIVEFKDNFPSDTVIQAVDEINLGIFPTESEDNQLEENKEIEKK